MKKKTTLLILLALLVGCAITLGAGSITFTVAPAQLRGLYRLELDWTSDASGDVSSVTTNISGYLLRVTFIPDSGDTQPSDLYDVELQDSDDIDLLNGAGADLSQTTSTTLAPIIAGDSLPVVMGEIELIVSNSGAANGGTVVLYWQEP